MGSGQMLMSPHLKFHTLNCMIAGVFLTAGTHSPREMLVPRKSRNQQTATTVSLIPRPGNASPLARSVLASVLRPCYC